MRRTTWLLLALLSLLVVTSALGMPGPITGGGVGDGTTPATGDILSHGYDIANDVALTADVAPVAAHEALGGDASPYATTAASRIGAASIYRGGLGTAYGIITQANCNLAAIVIAGTDSKGAAWTQTFTESTEWARGGTDAASALALKNAINVGATASLYVVAGIDPLDDNKVGLAAIPGKNTSLDFTGDGAGTCAAEINGGDGFVSANLVSRDTTASTYRACLGTYYGAVEFNDCASTPGALAITGTALWASTGYVEAATYVKAGTDFLCGDDYNPSVSAAATDVAPVITTITTQEPYAATPPTTTPTNTTGGNLNLAPANGSRRLADPADNDGMCGGAACTGADGTTLITIPVQVDGVTTNCVLTHGAATAAGVFHCNGHTEADCGTSVVAAMTVSPCTLITGTAANNVVSFKRVAGSTSDLGAVVVTVGGGSNIVAENGVDGKLVVSSAGTATAPNIIASSSTTSGISLQPNGTVSLTSLATEGLAVYSGTVYIRLLMYAQGGLRLTNGTTLTDAVDGWLKLSHSGGTAAGGVSVYPQTVTCTDDGGGTHSTVGCTDIVPTSNVIQLVCEDANGCTLSLEETNWSATVSGHVTLVGPAANHTDVADEAGKLELAGGAAMAMDALDTLNIVYAPAALTWVETSRAAN